MSVIYLDNNATTRPAPAVIDAMAAILAEKKANAEGLQARARALAGSGGKAMVKLEVARALKGKKILFVPSGGGSDLRMTDMNDLLQTYGALALSNKQVPTP